MKGALLLAVLGAVVVLTTAQCPLVPYYECVKADKPAKCSAVEVCKEPYKEICGNKYCEYPYKCASLKKTECKDFLKIKQRCEKRKVCKEVKKPCGYGACSLYEDCVKEKICVLKKFPVGRKLMRATAYSEANSDGYGSLAVADSSAHSFNGEPATATARAGATDGGTSIATSSAVADDDRHPYGYGYDGGYEPYYDPIYGYYGYSYEYKDQLVCEDQYSCVAKEPCKDVIVHRCVEDYLRPGIDVCSNGYNFHWFLIKPAQKCGDEFCGIGYKCATVEIQKCEKECGDAYCPYGHECVSAYDDDYCKDYAYLETICRDVYEPVCVPLSPYLQYSYKPPCKTVYKCAKDESVCGNEYCGYGYVCAVDYKRSCAGDYDPYYSDPSDPVVIKKVEKKDKPKRQPFDAFAAASSVADDSGTATATEAFARDEGLAEGYATADTDDSSSGSHSAADALFDTATVDTFSSAGDGERAESDAIAGVISG